MATVVPIRSEPPAPAAEALVKAVWHNGEWWALVVEPADAAAAVARQRTLAALLSEVRCHLVRCGCPRGLLTVVLSVEIEEVNS
jgi:hypothetical protein